MDSVDTFMSIFERAITDRSSSNLTNIFKDGPKYFQNISGNESESALRMLFDEQKGLLRFLNNELNSRVSRKGFDIAIKEGFHFLEFIMVQFAGKFESYITRTKQTCQLALTTRCSMFIQKAACKAFNTLINLFKEYDMNLRETVNVFVNLFQKVDIKERSLLFFVLGTISKHDVEITQLQEYSTLIMRQLMNDFAKKYMSKPGSQSSEIETYLDVLTDMLVNLSDRVDENNRRQLYTWAKALSSPETHQSKKPIMRSAIKLLFRHTSLFSEYLYRDYIFWYDLLTKLAKAKNINGKCAKNALRYFYREIGTILKEKDSEEDKEVFLFFKNYFEKELRINRHLDTNTLRFIVYGFSQMAAACRTYLTERNVKEMFSLVAHCAMPLYSRDDLEQADLETVCDYQNALAEIVAHTSGLSMDQIHVLLKLSILLIKKYPELPVTSQALAISSLMRTIANIRMIDKSLLEEFLYNLIHDGVVWSCSHTLLVDAELDLEWKNLQERATSYKNYLPLWLQLVELRNYESHRSIQTLQEFVDSMIRVCIILIGKLNLRTKVNEDNIFADAALARTAENKEDFRIFVNLVDLYVDILKDLESELIKNTLNRFLTKIISTSYKHPLVSGFYKLIRACFKHISNLARDEIETELLELLYKYIMSVLDTIVTFSNELLNACLYLILDMPLMYVARLLEHTTQTFKIAFTAGLSDFDLAYASLNTLEKWTRHLENGQTKTFLHGILPLLEPYLQSKESTAELSQDIIKSERKVIKCIVLIDDEKSLQNFQQRLLLFLASLDTDVITDFIHERSMEIGATWDRKELLKYSLPIVDMHIHIYFDKILPRLITLSQYSGDSRTKAAACELLHCIAQFILGKTSQNSDRLVSVYKLLIPALLHLGCDSDDVARKIFQPLMVQLTHWLSSNNMLESRVTMNFLDSLFGGLSNDSNSSLREFSGMCLAEFTKWCLRQDVDETKIQRSVYAVVQKLTNFALHPFACKRVAAAIAFNHLYTVLREEEEIVTVYWLEIFYCFVKSLDGCDDPAIGSAISHAERVLVEKEDLFNEKFPHRRKPAEFDGTTLADAAKWLLDQCGSLDQHCRKTCMKLFTTIVKYTADFDSPEAMINDYIDGHGVGQFNRIILKNLKPKVDRLSSSILLPLLRSFDCYIWLIREKLIDAEVLFSSENPEREVIFDCAKNVVHAINMIKAENKEEYTLTLSKEFEDVQILQCEVTIMMFDFLQVLLNEDAIVIPEFFVNVELCELIAKCVLQPQTVGFDTKNLLMIETLSSVMENLLNSIMLRANDTLQNLFKSQLVKYVEVHVNDFFNLEKIMFSGGCSDLKQHVKGLSILERCKILSRLYKDKMVLQYPKKDVEHIFNSLKQEVIGELICVNMKPAIMDYLQSLMELLLMHYEPSMTRTLVKLIANRTMLGPDTPKVAHGLHFLNLFKDTIFTYMLRDVEMTVNIFRELLQSNGFLLLTVTEDLLMFTQRRKKKLREYVEAVANTIIRNFVLFERAVSNLEDRKERLLSICGMAVHLKDNPMEVASMNDDFYMWVLKQLTQNSDMDHRICILKNFLICLTDMTSDKKPELVAIIKSLRADGVAAGSSNPSEQNIQDLKVMNCYRTLLTLLPITRSVVVYESIILFAAGISEALCNEKTNDYLEQYFACISDEYVSQSLDISYKLFVNLNRRVNERFDILRMFLLPTFQFCKTAAIQRFFETNIKDIYTTIKDTSVINQSLVGNSSEVEQLIVSKIGCYDLIAIMFAKVHIKNIDNVESVITQNAVGEVKTGKELLQNLYSNALRVRTLKKNSEHWELMRLLHCSAYNCSIAIVCLKKEEDFYVSIFAENRKKGQLIWDNIVDCDKQYNFNQTLKEHLKQRKQLINIRKSINERRNVPRCSHIYSYNLATSTLDEDINAYDFNRSVLRSKTDNREKEESMSMTFEADELNNHECMASICGALKHMVSQDIVVPSTTDNIVAPKWLECFCNSMKVTAQNNVRLFMLKVILNMQSVFKFYRKTILIPMIYAVYKYLETNRLNYIITDVLVVLIDWEVAYLTNEQKPVAQTFWEVLIDKVVINKATDIPKGVYEYNMSLLKTILEMWHSFLDVPQNLSDKMRFAADGAVYLILICLANGMEKEIIRRNDVLEFLEKSIENWKDAESTVLQSCECLGLVLAYFEKYEMFAHNKERIINKVRSLLQQMQPKFESRLVKCIYEICKNYPNAVKIYFEFVTTNMCKVDPPGKAKCLEIFLLHIPNLTAQHIRRELSYMKFHDFLKNKILPCEKVALRIIDTVVPILPPSDLLPLINLVPPYIKSVSSEYRDCAYSIFMKSYQMYSKNTTNDADVKALLCLSKEILLNGILDPAEDLQERLLQFWTQHAQLTNSFKDRFLEILDMYTPNAGDTFLSFVLLMMLDLTSKSKDYTQKMFEPLHKCVYRDYKIALSWRRKNLGSRTPLFAPSFASEMNQTFTQMNLTLPSTFTFSDGGSFRSSEEHFRLQETQDPIFKPTMAQEEPLYSTDTNVQDAAFKVPKVPEPIHNRRSRRFLASSLDVSEDIRQREIKKNIHRAEKIKEEAMRQRSSVKLYRTYRIGDFPDIEISHSDLIVPLQQLAKKDPSICKALTVSIVCSLLNEARTDDYLAKIANYLKYMIRIHRGSNSLIAAIFEIFWRSGITDYPADIIAKVSRLNGLNFLGSLVLEERLIHGTTDVEPPKKKVCLENPSNLGHDWLQLTNLYESMNDIDVVLSIFRNHVTGEGIQEASFARAAGDWPRAKTAYKKAYENESEAIKEHAFRGLLTSLSSLCRWDDIDKHVNQKLNDNVDNIWDEPWRDWMFSWVTESHVRKLLENDGKKVHVIKSWLNDKAKREYVKPLIGEDLAMFLIPDELEDAREFLRSTLNEMRENWIRLHPLSAQLRICNLQKLRRVNDINVFLKTWKTAKTPLDLLPLIKFWSNSVPLLQDDILPWDKVISCRIYFASLLKDKKLDEWEEDMTQSYSETNTWETDETNVTERLHRISFNMQLKMIAAASNQKNKYIAKKYLRYLEQQLPHRSTELENQLLLTGSQIKCLSGEVELNVNKKMSFYASAWKHTHTLMRQNDLEPATNVGVRQQISSLASMLVETSRENDAFTHLLIQNDVILKDIKAENTDVDSVAKSLKSYSLNHLKVCCDITTSHTRECYFTLSKYCYDRLSVDEDNKELCREFISSTLRAMRYGSLKASRYFPCLLKPEYFEDEKAREIFLEESKEIKTWLFLSWQAPLFSHLGTSFAPLIIPILERIVETYPNAVIYTLRLTLESNPALLNNTSTYKIRQILFDKPEVGKFLMAMKYVVQPELYLLYHLSELEKNLSQGTATAIDIFMKNVFPNAGESMNSPKPGRIYDTIKEYKTKIKDLEQKKPEELRKRLSEIVTSLKSSLKKPQRRTKLKDYSPWLQQFCGNDLEIPGQYSGDRKPMPQYHANIMKVDPIVRVMHSLHKPIQITLVGNDVKEYKFLVKFGEDLRLDQRLQQLFTAMNKTLNNDAACRQRRLSINTYQVIPLSSSLGLIEWIEDTKSLQEFVEFTLTGQQIEKHGFIYDEYFTWLRDSISFKREEGEYRAPTMKYDAANVTKKISECINKTVLDAIRRTLTVLCPSLESFVALRRNFITTYATMCVAHWIFGIGDRHLQNTLVVVGSGRCLGIDFGFAFDAAIGLVIPELTPFRLTPQIQALLKPFTEKDLLGTIMIHTLRALRNEQAVILACMDVFVHEPLNWTEKVNKALKEDGEEATDVKWLPKKKISVVRQKLNGIHPSMVTLNQLKNRYSDKDFDRYYTIVLGNDDTKRTRSTIKHDHLTPEEQVECLLDQATDLNILGRTNAGWTPWL